MPEVKLHLTGIPKQYQDEESFKKLFPKFIPILFNTLEFNSGNVFITLENETKANKVSRFVTKHKLLGGKLKVCNLKKDLPANPVQNPIRKPTKPKTNDAPAVKNTIIKIIPSFSFKKLDDFDIEIVDDELADSFCCSICMFTFTEPSNLPCGHIFCKNCISNWLKRNNTCPNCKSKCSAGNITKAFKISEILDKMKIHCITRTDANESDECSWQGKKSELQEHLQVCQNRLIQCNRCNWVDKRKLIY